MKLIRIALVLSALVGTVCTDISPSAAIVQNTVQMDKESVETFYWDSVKAELRGREPNFTIDNLNLISNKMINGKYFLYGTCLWNGKDTIAAAILEKDPVKKKWIIGNLSFTSASSHQPIAIYFSGTDNNTFVYGTVQNKEIQKIKFYHNDKFLGQAQIQANKYFAAVIAVPGREWSCDRVVALNKNDEVISLTN